MERRPHPMTKNSRHQSTLQLTILVAIILVAGLARMYRIGYPSVWIDELASMQFSAGWLAGSMPPLDVIYQPGIDMTDVHGERSLANAWHSVDHDTHPPLYIILLRWWREIFGPGDVVARGLSVICSLIAIIFLYDTARLLHGETVALWAAAIMALATPQIVFAQEIRSYVMLTMFILAMANAMTRIEILGCTKRRLWMLGIATFAGAMTHYLAIPAALAIGIYALICLRGKSRTVTFATMSTAGILFLILWGQTFWQQRANFSSNLNWNSDLQPDIYSNTVSRLASLPIQFFITPKISDIRSIAARMGAIFYLAVFAAIWRRELLLWVFIAAAIIGTTATSDLIQHHKALNVMRFTFPAAPAAYALISAVSSLLKRRWIAHAVPAIFVIGCAAAIPEAYNQYWKPNYRSLAASFDRHAGPDDLVVIFYQSQPSDWYQSLLLSAVAHYSAYPHRPMVALSQPASRELLDQMKSAPAIWLIGDTDTPVGQLIPSARTELLGNVPFAGTFTKINFPPTTSMASAP
jgi:uncharacterized membrane protein